MGSIHSNSISHFSLAPVPFFWLHIKKAAGQSVRKCLGEYYKETNRKNPLPFIALEKEFYNDTVNNYRVPLGDYDYRRMLFVKEFLYSPAEFDQMFKFAIIRNPYARAVSSWRYLTGNKTKWKMLTFVNARKSFQVFLERLPYLWRKNVNRLVATHTAPFFSDISDEKGRILLDYVARLETIQNDFNNICDRIGVPQVVFPKVHRGKGGKEYQRYYSPQTRKLVEELYRDDIDVFEYSFD